MSASTQNQALSALLFLYRHVLAREIGHLGEVIRARKPKRLPVVMTREEAKAVLGHLRGDKWLMASLMYGAGLRLTVCLCLRVQDIDFALNEIMVRDGNGAQDRRTMLPESVKTTLGSIYKRSRPSTTRTCGRLGARSNASFRGPKVPQCPLMRVNLIIVRLAVESVVNTKREIT